MKRNIKIKLVNPPDKPDATGKIYTKNDYYRQIRGENSDNKFPLVMGIPVVKWNGPSRLYGWLHFPKGYYIGVVNQFGDDYIVATLCDEACENMDKKILKKLIHEIQHERIKAYAVYIYHGIEGEFDERYIANIERMSCFYLKDMNLSKTKHSILEEYYTQLKSEEGSDG